MTNLIAIAKQIAAQYSGASTNQMLLNILQGQTNMALDLSKLTASIAKVSADVDKLIADIAASEAAVQPVIDAAVASVDAVSAKAEAALAPVAAPAA
jgi:hypothetical protein